jgi:hypothetical protein
MVLLQQTAAAAMVAAASAGMTLALAEEALQRTWAQSQGEKTRRHLLAQQALSAAAAARTVSRAAAVQAAAGLAAAVPEGSKHQAGQCRTTAMRSRQLPWLLLLCML